MSDQEEETRNPRTESVEVQLPNGAKLVCGLPNQGQWDGYLQALKKSGIIVASRQLVQQCATVPGTVPEVQEIFEQYPALAEPMADKLGNLIGDSFEVEDDGLTVTITVDNRAHTFRSPSQPDWESADNSMKDRRARTGEAFRQLLTNSYEGSVADLEALFLRYPGVIGPVTQALGKIAGAGFEITVKKG